MRYSWLFLQTLDEGENTAAVAIAVVHRNRGAMSSTLDA